MHRDWDKVERWSHAARGMNLDESGGYGDIDDYLALLAAYKDLLAKEDWKLLSQELPPKYDAVLVWDGEIVCQDYRVNSFPAWVTHWRPMPAPPDEEKP